MTKKSTFLILLFVGLLAHQYVWAQNDLLKGIFEKEAPEFNATIVPTTERGLARLAVYFTHSKINELEISFWIKDNGTLMQSDGEKLLISGLQKLGNRQQDTILIRGLKDQHVYTLGADFRNPQALSGKFSSQDLLSGYRYNFREPINQSTARVVDAMAKSPTSSAPVKPTITCQDPDIDVRIEPAGYCGLENRPAVMIQCNNCQGKEWEFSVEVRSMAMGQWQPLRYDGKRQPAVGVGLRTEPLCALFPGTFQVQVLAWGQNCPNPVIKTLNTNIVIAHPQLEQPANTQTQAAAVSSVRQEGNPRLPDTCFVDGRAILEGNTIKGMLTLSPYSPCGDLRPYAEVVYVHPGHRNITLDKVPLIPGAGVPFTISLDQRDVNRGIHTIQVVAYVQENNSSAGIPLESFWLRANTQQELSASIDNGMMESPGSREYPPSNSRPTEYQATQPAGDPGLNQNRGVRSPEVAAAPPANSADEELYIDPELMKSTINEVQVTATDPNCTPIQDLKVVFDSNQPVKPLFISWLNPRCCQVEGCSYTVWSGPDPKQLSLVMKGKKSGAVINEVLHGTSNQNQYFEVVVETGNGVRKAAYALGAGPLYGIQEILDYHDFLFPPAPTQIEAVKDPNPIAAGSETGAAESAVLLNPVLPQHPISEFEACKYERETTLYGGQPISVGQEISLKYDFNDSRYRYTLYHQPVGMSDWVVAPGTSDLQKESEFTFTVQPYHAGKYVILSYKPSGDSGWGCLSVPIEKAIQLEVQE